MNYDDARQTVYRSVRALRDEDADEQDTVLADLVEVGLEALVDIAESLNGMFDG